MAGDEGGLGDLDAEFRLERPHRRQAHRHQRRLGVLGEGEVLDRTFLHQPEQSLIQRVVDFLEHLAGGREGLGQLGAHADSLAALAGKGEGEAHGSHPT